mgnify:FL=1
MSQIEKRQKYRIPPAGIAFLGGVLISFIYVSLFYPDTYVYDSAHYWALSYGFADEQGNLSLAAYPSDFRGYVFPLYLFLSRVFSHWLGISDSLGFICLVAVSVSFILTIVFPYLMDWREKNSWDFLKRWIPLFLVLFFWRGLLVYPLSDFYSLGFTLVACALFKWLYNDHRVWWSEIPASILIGVFLYAAYNTRTIYLFAVIVFACLICLRFLKEGRLGAGKNVIRLVCIVAGWFLLAAPQIWINHRYTGTWSLWGVDTTDMFSAGLFSFQLFNGLTVDRYETLLTPNDFGNIPNIYFYDDVGLQIIKSIGNYEGTLWEYIRLFFTYPLEVIGIYFRHLANLLNPVYGECYISNLHQFKIHVSVFNYILMVFTAIGGVDLLQKYRCIYENQAGKRKTKILIASFFEDTSLWWVIIFPCLAIIPGAPEVRFFFPAYVCMYGLLEFKIQWKRVAQCITTHPIQTILWSVVGLVVLSCVWSDTFANASTNVWLFL